MVGKFGPCETFIAIEEEGAKNATNQMQQKTPTTIVEMKLKLQLIC